MSDAFAKPEPAPAPESGWFGALLAAWIALSASVIAWGYGLSAFHGLASLPGWMLGAGLSVATAITAGRAVLRRESPSDSGTPTIHFTPPVFILYAGVAAVLTAGVITALGAAPSNWDSLTYHLARVGYYLQQGSLADFGANYFPQEQQARGASVLQCALITLSGGSDLLVGIPQLFSYAMCLASVNVLARQIGCGPVAALAAAAVFGLLTTVAVEAPTAQNDLVLVSYLGAGLVGALGYLARGQRGMLWLAVGGFALALSVKASALTCVPATAIVLSATVWRSPEVRAIIWRRLAILATTGLLAGAVFAAPGGYWKNWWRFGNPIGGPPMTAHAGGPESGGSRWRMGALNATRFAGDLFTLDGLPEAWWGAVGNRFKRACGSVLKKIGLDAESGVGARAPFSWTRPRAADENLSFFGWMGAVILIPGCIGALVLCRRYPFCAAFAFAFVIFLAGQAFAGPYDPWRGRLLLYGAIFAAPAAAWLFETPTRLLRRIAWGAAVVGAFAIVPALLWRSPNPLLSRPEAHSLFGLNRLEQMALHHASYPALATFDRLVPPHSRVIVAMPDNEYEYALFGTGLTRRLIPIGQARLHPELADTADFLIYDGRIRLPRQPTDIGLGYRWALRRLGPLRPADFASVSGLYEAEDGFAWMAEKLELHVRPLTEQWVNVELGARLPPLPEADHLVVEVDGAEFRAAFHDGQISASIPLKAAFDHRIAMVSPTGARSPLALGLSNDARQLSYRVRILQVSDHARFPIIR